MNLIETLQTLGREGVDFGLIPVASVKHLIEMKASAGRDIDRFDIDALRRLPGAENA